MTTAQQNHSIAAMTDIVRLESTPLDQVDMPRTTLDTIIGGTQIDPDAPAVTFILDGEAFEKNTVVSHRALLANVFRCANALRRLEIGRTDVVAYILPNLPETFYVIWGGEAAGIVLAINPLLEASQMAQLMAAANAKVLVALEPTPNTDIWQKSIDAAKSTPSLEAILTVGIGGYLKGPLGSLYRVGKKMRPAQAEGLDLPILSLAKEMAKSNSEGLDFPGPRPTDLSSMFCTGGTTGLPKIAKRTHFNEAYNIWAMSQFATELCRPGSTCLCGLPLFHTNAKLVTGLAPISYGGHIVLTTPAGYRGKGVIKNFWKIVEAFRVESFSGVPTVFSTLLEHPNTGHDISSLRVGVCGAAPMPVAVFECFEQKTGLRIMEGYGLTEGTVASAINPFLRDQPRIGSIGLRMPYQEMRIGIFDETGHFLRFATTGELGIIMISGPNVFAGYVDESHNEGIWINADGATWFNTGDLGRQDQDGYFWLTGRTKELIIRGGHNIDPKTIEEPLQKHPRVALAAAVGRPDARAGELPVAYVQTTDGPEVTSDEIIAFAYAQIPEQAAVPKDIIFIDEMPVTAVGKIYKRALNVMEIKFVVRREAENLGIRLTSLDVTQDPSKGLVVGIGAGDKTNDLIDKLACYTFNVVSAQSEEKLSSDRR